jgi:predicted dehydrogenase
MDRANMDRREFLACSAAAAGALTLSPRQEEARRIKVGVIGCGNVSYSYLPHLVKCPHAEVVSLCDIIPERAEGLAKRHRIPNTYPHIDKMLAGAPFDLLVNLTDMQEHEKLNRQAVGAGKHVWSEKPMAGSLAGGESLLALAREKNVRIWGAPVTVQSPQFAFMAKTIAGGALGRLAAAHASYGHGGAHWSSFFYEEGGGSMPDLGVYSITTLTGLLGPAKSVTAMTGIVTPVREIQGKGEVRAVAEDNAMLVLDHGDNGLSHVQCGFSYFTARGHDDTAHTLTLIGTKGTLGLVGHDWGPQGVDLATHDRPAYRREAAEKGSYAWQGGGSLAAECLATGKELLCTPEHALHVVEIITGARESQAAGRRVPLRSKFKWPLLS